VSPAQDPLRPAAWLRKRTGGVAQRKVYQPQGTARAFSWVLATVWFVLGVGIAASSPGDAGKGGTAGVIIGVSAGVVTVLLALWLGVLLATNGLTVTSDGLSIKHNLRTRLIGWPEVKSFSVGPGRGRNHYPALIICLTDGTQVITDVVSATARYPSQVAWELTNLQANAGSAH
jgi:hypothetical protein